MPDIGLLDLGRARRTPLIEQSEASECGLACLAMVAGYHGLQTDMPTLRRQFSLSLKGTTLKTLMDVAAQIGFSARPLRCEPEHLADMQLPAILHWDCNHFVVLTDVRGRGQRQRYQINDPGKGVRLLPVSEVSKHFTGVSLELTKTELFTPAVQRSNLRLSQLWSKITGLWVAIRQVFVLSLIIQFVALAMPFYLQIAIDTALPSADESLLAGLAFGFAGLALVNTVTVWLRTVVVLNLSNSLSYQMTVNLYAHLLKLPLLWFQKRHVGDIVSRFASTKPLTDIISQGMVTSVIDGCLAVFTLGLMFVYSPALAAIGLGTLVLYALVKLAFLHTLRLQNISAISSSAKESSSFIESMRGIMPLKAFGQENNRQRIWQNLKADAVNAQAKLTRTTATFDALTTTLTAFESILVTYLAVRFTIHGSMSIGMIFAYLAYKAQFMGCATRLVEQSANIRLLDVHLGRIADIALTEPCVRPPSGALEPLRGGISLRNVCFTYGVGEPEALKNVNLDIHPGELVALRGPSGGGKTTLLKIMIGLLEPSYGQVLIDDLPLASLDRRFWNYRIGSVLQDDSLYAGTLAENIAFFDPEIDMARVRWAAEIAGIAEDISRMPMHFETLVGDMGSALSGGQRQRIYLARALYPQPSILFMDEGTSNLEMALEERIVAAIGGLGITRVISAHRTAAIAAADRIIDVDAGRVSELPFTKDEEAA